MEEKMNDVQEFAGKVPTCRSMITFRFVRLWTDGGFEYARMLLLGMGPPAHVCTQAAHPYFQRRRLALSTDPVR